MQRIVIIWHSGCKPITVDMKIRTLENRFTWQTYIVLYGKYIDIGWNEWGYP